MTLEIYTPYEIKKIIAKRAQGRRLSLNLSRQSLADRSGVKYGTLKKFEETGQISLESLLKLALILEELGGFNKLFLEDSERVPASLDKLLEENSRKRGRK